MSILEIDREMQLDRQRRYFFCYCFAEERKKSKKVNTVNSVTE